MGISRLNSEGYYDPVAYEALSSIVRENRAWKPLVYICSPFADDPEANTAKARRYCRFAMNNGAIPFASHLMLPQFMREETERDKAMSFNKVYLGRCEQVWVFGDRISDGMAKEISWARRYGKKLRHFTEDCEEKK